MIKFRASVLTSAFAVSVALMLSGCASATAPSDNLGEPSIDEYQNVTAELDYATGTARTPVDDYRMDTPEVALKATRAIAVRADQCRAEFGLQPTAGSRAEVAPEPREDRRYGQWSVALASQFGFDLPPEAFDAGESEAQGQECDRSARESLIEVLAPISEYNLDMRIRDQASALALAHETGRASAASWRACVEQRGITVENDPAFPSQSYREQGKQAEILAAVAQAECGVSTGAVQTLYDLQARYEAAFVDRQSAALQELSDKRDSLVAALDEVVAEG